MRALLLLVVSSLLSGCIPAVYIHLFNATGEQIIISKEKSKEVVTIAPNASADFTTFYLPSERLVIRTPKHSWRYAFTDLRVPPSLYQQHAMVMRAFAAIDSRGEISLLAPPHDDGMPHKIPQPNGFPVRRQKT
jgi:hypothetical protein